MASLRKLKTGSANVLPKIGGREGGGSGDGRSHMWRHKKLSYENVLYLSFLSYRSLFYYFSVILDSNEIKLNQQPNINTKILSYFLIHINILKRLLKKTGSDIIFFVIPWVNDLSFFMLMVGDFNASQSNRDFQKGMGGFKSLSHN